MRAPAVRLAKPAAAATVTVGPRGVHRIRAGHPWVYRPDIVSGPTTDAGTGGPALVTVLDGHGRRLGCGTWAASTRLALRMLSRAGEPADVRDGRPAEGHGDLEALVAWVSREFPAAHARRTALHLPRDAYRVVHAEADRIPGLIVDRYVDAAVVQTTSVAMNAARSALAPRIAEWLSARVVVARDDGSTRDFEDLPRWAGVLVGNGDDTRVRYRVGANFLEADLLTDGKTGGFLDQTDNHLAVAALAPDGASALDAFTYHGGFALALARRGGRVLGTDESAAAVARSRDNAERNGLSNATFREANAFELLRELESQRARFDVVVLDPPALAKRSAPAGRHPDAALTAADRAYRELFMRGARITEAGGLLVVCSCSGRMSRAHFEEVVVDALADSGRSAQVLARLGAAADHPELAGVLETGHLKCWLLRVL